MWLVCSHRRWVLSHALKRARQKPERMKLQNTRLLAFHRRPGCVSLFFASNRLAMMSRMLRLSFKYLPWSRLHPRQEHTG